MSLIDRSGQHVGDGSNAIQVSGDAIIGNSTSEVISICELVVSKQMMALRDEAMEVALNRARQFGEEVAERIASEMDDRIIDKLRDPDVQFSINQAVTQVARKGLGTKSEVLKELIASKIKNDDEEEDLIIDHAIEITQRLTTSEIKLLSLIYYFRFVSKYFQDENLKEIIISGKSSLLYPQLTPNHCKAFYARIYNEYGIDFMRILGEIDTIKNVNTEMLQIKGCLLNGKHFTTKFYDALKTLSQIDNENTGDFPEQFPLIADILSRFSIESHEEFDRLVPSQVGLSIARNYLVCHGFLS